MTRDVNMVKRMILMPLCLAMLGCNHGPATVTVDMTARHQTVSGWEVTARGWEFDKANDRFDGSATARRDEIARLLANGIGIDRIRLEIKSGMENPVDYWTAFMGGRLSYAQYRTHFYEKVNDNGNPATLDARGIQFADLDWHVENFVLPLKRQVEARGRRFHLNLAYVDFKWTDLKGSLSHARNSAEYAEFVTAAFVHLKVRYGLVPDSLEIIVEPDNSDDWSGTAIGRAIVATSKRLDASGFPDVEIIAPSTAKAQRALDYYADIRAVPGAAARLNTFAYHRYDGEPDASDLRKIATAAKGAGMRTAMLEYVDGDITDLIADLNDGEATAWQQYGIATRVQEGKSAKPGWLIEARGASTPSLTISPVAQALALVFANVEPGAVRTGGASSSEAAGVVAFANPSGKAVIVVHTAAEMPLAIMGVRDGRYRLLAVDREGRTETPSTVKVKGPVRLQAAAGTTYALVEL